MRRAPLLPAGQAPRPADLVPRALPPAPRAPARARRAAPPPRRATRDQRAMSPGQRAGGDARKDGPAGGGGGRPATAAGAWAVSALCLLLSVGSAAACLLLGAQAAALQGRVAALEEERELLRRAGPPGALAAWAEPHLERLLREVRGAGRGGGRGLSAGRAGCAAVSLRRGGRRLRVRVPGGVVRSPLRPRGRFPGRSGRGKRELEGPFRERGGRERKASGLRNCDRPARGEGESPRGCKLRPVASRPALGAD